MALVKIGYFASAGYTETGGLAAFLSKVAPDATWTRLFPAVLKPGPKFGRTLPAPTDADNGVTGGALTERVVGWFAAAHASDLDGFVIIDDADCRFCGQEGDPAPGWVQTLVARLETLPAWRPRPIFALFASQEIEAWLVADWPRTFAVHHTPSGEAGRQQWILHQQWMRRRVLAVLGGKPIEDYGCPKMKDAPSCEHKLSEDMAAAWGFTEGDPDPPPSTTPPRYSKRIDGPWMLQRVDPDALAKGCPRVFAPSFFAIRSWAQQAAPLAKP